ncbi:MAG: tetratricopeptide repeat protein [Rhodospirillaceae bacterium]|jgi:protein O-GlcNAc transferase|nr:tetratricopeptide repeat protein [Rhodospirillaceae bacterium]MBT4490897.1 tetratricopeptide repeat protein [Rhodospirillaceae bacterium]MBT5191564.1 tetratricopeptide repeat protein [Rhodospirillaceae bacterium]MBT5894597.1 tetratricopeptide repeat protein [Rhodospirillaceae bacterium]MBT6429362.1 tetratricopeptide repeat protein [Rhodospirillaceae bacterium]
MEQIDPRAEFEGGNGALAEGRAGDAVAHYRRALGAAPDVVEIHHNLTAALEQLDRLEEAADIARLGLERRPDYAPLHVALANLLSQGDDTDGARRHYELALQQDCELAAAWSGLGGILMQTGFYDKASEKYHNALKINKKHTVSINNLAICQLHLGRQHEALALYRDLVALNPEIGKLHGNLGQVLQGLGRHDEAVRAFRRALQLDQAAENVAPFLMQSLMYQCAWDDMPGIMQRVLDETRRRLRDDLPITVQPFSLVGTSADAALRLSAARSYTKHCAGRDTALRERLGFSYMPASHERLRIGYISPDFRQHSVATAFKDLIAQHDRDGFDWYGYVVGAGARDQMTDYFRSQFDHFTDLDGMDPEAAARHIHGDNLDVLVDLSGFTRHSALDILQLRPSPVQAHYLGYGATLGSEYVQYLLIDTVHTPPHLAAHCAEALVYLPDSFMATSRPDIAPAPPTRQSQGLPETGTVFANFNAHYKFDPETFGLWLDLLAELSGSVLWLLQGSDVAMANLRDTATARGIDAQRLVFAPRAPHPEHLARQSLADISLDCRHHTGGVSTLDALWSGVPVISMAGDNQSARTGASILHAAGLAELAVDDMDAYRAKALELARDPAALAALKARVRGNQTTAPLFDTPRLARHLEAAYKEMARCHRTGEAIGSFAATQVL